MCYVYAHNYLSGHGGGGHCLSLRKTSRPDSEIRHRRVSQYAELQIVTSDACLPRHAGIRAKTLSLRGLQNTLTGLCARTARYSDFPSMKTAKNMDEKFNMMLPSMKNAKNVDGKFKNQLPSMKTAKNVDGNPNLGPHAARLPRPCQIHGVRANLSTYLLFPYQICWFRAECDM